MKSLLLALVAALAFATVAPAATAAATTEESVSAHYTGAYHTHATYTKKVQRAKGYWYRGRWYPAATYRAPRSVRTAPRAWTPAKAAAASTNKWALPEYKPNYNASGKYIPTSYIYQETNGSFSIAKPSPTPAPVRPGSGAANLRRALGNNGAPGAAPAAAGAPGNPPAPPNPPSGAGGRAAPGTP